MQANTANEHSQMLAQVPANACSDSESRKCSLVLLLVSYSTLAHKFSIAKLCASARTVRLRITRALDQHDEQARLFE